MTTKEKIARLLDQLGIRPDDPDAIARQLDRERRYRRYLMTNEPDRNKRAEGIRASTERAHLLDQAYNNWVFDYC